MKDLRLDPEEKKILEDFDGGDYQTCIKDKKQASTHYQKLAKNHTKKTKNINIRVTEKTYHNIKTLSQREGLTYQSFLGSIINLGLQRRKKILDLELA